MLGDYSVEMEEGTAAAVRELRETARELEVSRSDYAEMQRAVQLLQVRTVSSTSFTIYSRRLQTSWQSVYLFDRHLSFPKVVIGKEFFSHEMTASRTYFRKRETRKS